MHVPLTLRQPGLRDRTATNLSASFSSSLSRTFSPRHSRILRSSPSMTLCMGTGSGAIKSILQRTSSLAGNVRPVVSSKSTCSLSRYSSRDYLVISNCLYEANVACFARTGRMEDVASGQTAKNRFPTCAPNPPPICGRRTPRLKKPWELRARNVPVPQPFYKALGAQNISALAVSARHTSVTSQRADPLALQDRQQQQVRNPVDAGRVELPGMPTSPPPRNAKLLVGPGLNVGHGCNEFSGAPRPWSVEEATSVELCRIDPSGARRKPGTSSTASLTRNPGTNLVSRKLNICDPLMITTNYTIVILTLP